MDFDRTELAMIAAIKWVWTAGVFCFVMAS